MTILVIHGAGLNMRGKAQTEIFGTHSDVATASHGGITGFGIVGYDLPSAG